MWINQYYNQWFTQNKQLHFYCYNDYTWNSPSIVNNNYAPFFNIDHVWEIPQDTQFTIEITNNSEFDPYDASDLQIDFGSQFFNLNQIMDPNDPYSIYPEQSWAYTCTLPQTVNPNAFKLIPPNSAIWQNVDVTIRVVFPEIFTGDWLTTQFGGMYQYDSSSSAWTPY